MREILFKAKRKNWHDLPKEQWWVEGYYVSGKWYLNDNIIHAIIPTNAYFYPHCEIEYEEIDTNTLCQYTGLTDKNDVKIWENDICSALLVKEDRENCIVRYGRRAENFKLELGFNLEWTKTNYLRCDICWWVENRELEVIGNIFDNPELLEEADE